MTAPAARPARAITFAVPGKPMGWMRARSHGRQRYTPAAMAQRQREVQQIAAIEMRGAAPLDGPVRLILRAVFAPPPSWPAKRRDAALSGQVRPTVYPDLDNAAKLVADALNGVAYRDDRQITEMRLAKAYGPQALTVVTVEEA